MSTMLKDIDERARRTRNRIARAVSELAVRQPLETITVKQLAGAAGISRSTFYSHFTSLGDYLIRSYAWLLERGALVSAALPGGEKQALPVRAILDHMAPKRAYVAATLDSAYRPAMTAAGEERLRLVAATNLQRLRPDLTEADRQAIASFLAGGFMGMLKRWQGSGMQESPESLQARFEALAERVSAPGA
jgi:AcrR family transcriptional regulator